MRGIASAPNKSYGLAIVAAALISDDPGHASKLLAEAEHTAKSSTDPAIVARDLKDLSKAIVNGVYRSDGKRNPATAQWASTEARRIIGIISVPEYAVQAKLNLAEHMAEDQRDVARRLLNDAQRQFFKDVLDVKDTDSNLDLARDIVDAMCKIDPERAAEIAQRMPEGFFRDQAYETVASTLSRDDAARAEIIAHRIADPGIRATALATVARSLAEQDAVVSNLLLEHALRVARAATYPVDKEIALIVADYDPGMAIKIAANGDNIARITGKIAKTNVNLAEEIALAIAEPEPQARALTELAELYMREHLD